MRRCGGAEEWVRSVTFQEPSNCYLAACWPTMTSSLLTWRRDLGIPAHQKLEWVTPSSARFEMSEVMGQPRMQVEGFDRFPVLATWKASFTVSLADHMALEVDGPGHLAA